MLSRLKALFGIGYPGGDIKPLGTGQMPDRAAGAPAAPTAPPRSAELSTSPITTRPFVVIDCETTGFSHTDGHRIVSLALLEPRWMPNNKVELHSLYLVFNPERRSDAGARRVHGLQSNYLDKQDKFSAWAYPITTFVGDRLVIGHNVTFDLGFLNAELARSGTPTIANESFCTMRAYRSRFPGQRSSLDVAATAHEIDVSLRVENHGAFVDALITLQLYYRMELKISGLSGFINPRPINEKL